MWISSIPLKKMWISKSSKPFEEKWNSNKVEKKKKIFKKIVKKKNCFAGWTWVSMNVV
jgi:hypothetical protein